MNPKLAGCLFASMFVGACCAGAAIVSGWGVIAGLAIYSLTGSVCLVPFALLAVHGGALADGKRVPVTAASKPAWA